MAVKKETAMERRKWDPRAKVLIILEGMKGKPVADICTEHQISQTQYYQWRDRFLANAHQVFIDTDKKEQKLTRENARLRRMIGDLTVELKKTEEWLR
jgi:transposase-like protein